MNRSWKLVVLEALLVLGLFATTGLEHDFFVTVFFVLNVFMWIAVCVDDGQPLDKAVADIKANPHLFVVSLAVTILQWLALVATGHYMLALSSLVVHIVVAVNGKQFRKGSVS